jgi:hypothetical protein
MAGSTGALSRNGRYLKIDERRNDGEAIVADGLRVRTLDKLDLASMLQTLFFIVSNGGNK